VKVVESRVPKNAVASPFIVAKNPCTKNANEANDVFGRISLSLV
jgi:hypothetical protein